MTTKREKAFTLFDQGKTPKYPEVEALGLKLESLRKYYGQWKKQVSSGTSSVASAALIEEAPAVAPVVAPAPPAKVPAYTLKTGEEFELRGKIYRAGVKDGDILMTMIPTQPELGCQVIGINEMVKPTKLLLPSDHA